MDTDHTCMLGAHLLSDIQEDSSGRVLPPIDATGSPGEPERQKVMRPSDVSLPVSPLDDNRSLLEELSRIEAELRATVHLDVERQQEEEFLRQQETRLMRTHLVHLSLSQRVGKPWVSSYFKTFPMHIYCLPVQAGNQRPRKWGLPKRK